MTRDTKITETYTAEITVSGWSDEPAHFRKIATEQIKDLYIDVVSVGVGGNSSVKIKKVKIISVERR